MRFSSFVGYRAVKIRISREQKKRIHSIFFAEAQYLRQSQRYEKSGAAASDSLIIAEDKRFRCCMQSCNFRRLHTMLHQLYSQAVCPCGLRPKPPPRRGFGGRVQSVNAAEGRGMMTGKSKKTVQCLLRCKVVYSYLIFFCCDTRFYAG